MESETIMSMWVEKRRILVTCAKGTAPYLLQEILALGMPVLEESEAAVETAGTMEDAMLLNLSLRTGQRVLFLLHEGRAKTPGDLYDGIIILPWEDILHADGYVCITSSVGTPEIRDPRYANLKVKDAIVDRLRNLFRCRPDSGSDRTGAVVHVYWKDDRYRIFADTSGEPLSRRGYRKIPLTAPMQETLAAAVIMATGWTGDGPLINPMCGSGTLAIEAALIARRRAPGLLRDNFGFLHLKGFDDDQWQQVRLKVRKGERKDIPGRIFATDISLEAVRAAGVNAGRAKMGRYIQFRQCPFENTSIPAGKGIVIMNPPYGQRLGEEADLAGLYKGIGDFFKERCEEYRGYVFTANPDLAKKVGLRTSRRIILYNGELESRLLEYEIYTGSRKQQTQEEKPKHMDGELLPHGDSGPGADRGAVRGQAKITRATGDSLQSVPPAPVKTRSSVIIKSPEKIGSQRCGKSGREGGREPGRMLSRRITPREATLPGLNAVPDEIPGQVGDLSGAAARHQAADSAPERRRVIPKK
ncbi:MAG: rRNA (guanine2445-N2)-methyltransferase [Thermodesulfobacteriota bacterium]|nr:rRNA (guanine2445-N2)-methyltransferase [Thermodesulfobacteriota bacterium]